MSMPISHYYGDAVRQFFFGLAALITVCIPFSGNLQLGLIVGIPSIVILVVLAGFTNPRGIVVMVANSIVAAVGVFLVEGIAIVTYGNGNYIPFALLECMSVLFIVALYFSVKTVRAMLAHQVGHNDQWHDFEDEDKQT